MSTSFGAYPLKDAEGNVTVGTTEADIQQIYGSLYSAGLISGGVVTRSATAMTYTVSNGVAAFPLVVDASSPYKPENQRTVLGGWGPKVLTTTAPSSGTRLDMIYARQLTPTNDSDANVVVEFGTTLPARAVLLDAYIVSSTNTNSLASVKSVDVKYSIPFGAPRGTPWFSHRSTFNGTFTSTKLPAAAGTFYLPSDRYVTCNLSTSLNSNGAVKFDNARYCEAAYAVYLNDQWKFTWTTGGLHQAMQDFFFEEALTLAAGPYSVRVDRWKSVGDAIALPFQRYGQGNLGMLFQIKDAGPAA